MTYNKVHPGGWHDAPNNTTPITADAMNTIEQGIADNAAQLAGKVDAPTSGTASSTTFLRGDGAWATPAGGGGGGGGGSVIPL